MNIKFSVIIPLYNKAKYIEKVLSSIICQKYNNYEIIIIDDCSTDESYTIADSFMKKFQTKNIILLQNEMNSGVGYTRNKGLELVTGEYIIFLDADDEIVNSELFNKLYQYIEKYDSNYIVLSRNYYDKMLKPEFSKIKKYINSKDYHFYEILKHEKFIVFSNFPFGGSASAVISKKLIDEIKFDENARRFEDWLFFLQVFLKTNPYYYSYPSVKINFDPNSLSRNNTISEIEQLPKLYDYLANTEYTIVRKSFFWMWLNSNIKSNKSFNDNCKIIYNNRKNILHNASLHIVPIKYYITIFDKFFFNFLGN